MALMRTPDLGSPRRLALVAAVVTLGVWALLAGTHGDISRTLGDTDDAMRLVRVRALLAGQGWYDQRMLRLQPPLGSVMHWSRLLDGALAGANWLLLRFVSPPAAEWALRFAWPLLWVAPAVVCALCLARRLGGRSAVLVGAVLLLLDVQLYAQFRPGRIDHHNVQIVMAMLAAVAAVGGSREARWAALAGAASALGLAVGIEALAFHALVGAGFALRLVMDPAQVRAARAYGGALAGVGLAAFLVQTPPGLWASPACDALALNLVLALVAGGGGLALVAGFVGRSGARLRIGLVAAVGLGAAGAYLISDPACLRGPMAQVDPRLGPIWLHRIQELRSWPALWRLDRDAAVTSITTAVFSLAAGVFLAVRARRQVDPGVWLALALVTLAGLAASQALRMDDYLFWFGVPVVAAALSRLVEERFQDALLAALSASFVLAPQNVALAANNLGHAAAPLRARAIGPASPDPCLDTAAYRSLAAVPPGLVAAPIDLGPFVLAHSRDTVLSAPYHRMAWGILAAHEALDAPAPAAEARLRALGVRYVLDCPKDASEPRPGGLTAELRRGATPAWLRPLAAPDAVLRLYALEPQR
jgi:hypothetical protein